MPPCANGAYPEGRGGSELRGNDRLHVYGQRLCFLRSNKQILLSVHTLRCWKVTFSHAMFLLWRQR